MDKELSSKLLQMKEKVEQAETRGAQLQGRLDGLMDRLKTEFGIDTLAQAEKELSRLDAQLDKEESEFAKQVEDLNAKFINLGV